MSSELIRTDETYRKWIQDIGERFSRSQIKAAVSVNEEMLRFYWSLGKDISSMKSEAKYGSGFFRTVSNDLHELFPTVHSFSVTNLKYMCYFYEVFPEAGNRQQPVDDLDALQNDFLPEESLKLIFRIPWGHIVQILTKCSNDRAKVLFYVRKTAENNWSRSVLLNYLGTDLYERQGKAITNFAQTLPAPQSDLAQEITRDPYSFDFLTLRERYNEKELKDALMDNISSFLLELGNGFAYVGREYRLEIGDTENFLDMLFYNIKLHCYVVVEVKIREFESGDMGQLGTYMVAVNHQLKGEHDNPTLGLLICRSKDNVKARYALEASTQPMGISQYDLSTFLPDRFKGTLPTIAEIETELAE